MQNPAEKSKNETDSAQKLKNGTVLELTIAELNADGFGIATAHGVAVHVANAVPGDRVTVRVEHVSRQSSSAWARILHPPQRGENWKRHFCPASEQDGGKCGGCPLGHVTRDVYKDVKLSAVVDALTACNLQILPSILHTGAPKHYRNKSNFVVHRSKKGTVILGSYAPRSHRVAAMDGCKINARAITRIQREMQTLFEKNNAPVHPAPGGIRYVTVKAFDTGALLADLVVNDTDSQDMVPIAEMVLNIPDI